MYHPNYTLQELAAIREQIALHPDLIAHAPGNKITGHALAAKNMRILLKKAFPGVKFAIQSSAYANGSSADIRYLALPGAPTTKQVEEICRRFEPGDFDGMTDSYNSFNDPKGKAFRAAFGSVKYSHAVCDRDAEAIAQWQADQLAKAAPKASAHRRGRRL